MLNTLLELIKALEAGKELKDPAVWKKGQNLLNKCALIITGIVALLRWQFPDLPVTDEQIIEIASVLAMVLALINNFITTASTKKIGSKNKE